MDLELIHQRHHACFSQREVTITFLIWNHIFSTFAKFSEKLTLLPAPTAFGHTRVHVRFTGYEMLVFQKILRTY